MASQAQEQFFNRLGPGGIQGGAWFIHQQHLGLERKQTGNAELLLLLKLQSRAFSVQFVLYGIQKKDLLKRLFNSGVYVVFVKAPPG
jgi:hypothetical protein